MRPLVGIAVPAKALDHGLSAAVAANYAGAFRRLGYATEILATDVQDRASLAQLVRPEFRLLMIPGGWVVTPLGALGEDIRSALERVGTPLLVLIADPVFGSIMAQIVNNMPRRAALFFIDPSFAHGIQHWIGARPHAAYLPSGFHSPPPPPPTAGRPIRAVFSGLYFVPDETHAAARQNPAVFPLYQALIEEVLFDYATPLLHHALRLAPDRGVPPDMDNADFRLALLYADNYIRGRRRGLLLRRLLRHPVHVFTNIAPNIADQHPDAVVSPPVPHKRMLELMRASRVTVVCQPHFPGALNERIIHAMQAGSVVITTPNPRTGQLFSHAQELWSLDPRFSNLDVLIDAAGDDVTLTEMRARAQQAIAGQYTPDGNLRYMLAIMRDHGMLDDDLPHPPGQMMRLPPEPVWRM